MKAIKHTRFGSVMILALSLFILLSATRTNTPSGYEITQNMIIRAKKIKTLTCTMTRTERISGKMITKSSFVKLNRHPFKVYTKNLYPEEGLEVLYVTGKYNNMALINPDGFPWFNVKLDPFGNTMRKDQHHTIFDAGYDLFVTILEHLFKKYDSMAKSLAVNKGIKNLKGIPCWTIEFTNPNFRYINYTVKKGETLDSIAKKFMINAYMLIELNEDVDDYTDIVAGQKITIPNDYSPRMVLYIDKVRMIPIKMEIYDKKGLYEQYEYDNVKIDSGIQPEEFTEEFEAYGF